MHGVRLLVCVLHPWLRCSSARLAQAQPQDRSRAAPFFAPHKAASDKGPQAILNRALGETRVLAERRHGRPAFAVVVDAGGQREEDELLDVGKVELTDQMNVLPRLRVVRCCVTCKRARSGGTRKPRGAYYSVLERKSHRQIEESEDRERRFRGVFAGSELDPTAATLLPQDMRSCDYEGVTYVESCSLEARETAWFNGIWQQLSHCSDRFAARPRCRSACECVCNVRVAELSANC
jgi:hypothetical protein